jgi:hypothetical protein
VQCCKPAVPSRPIPSQEAHSAQPDVQSTAPPQHTSRTPPPQQTVSQIYRSAITRVAAVDSNTETAPSTSIANRHRRRCATRGTSTGATMMGISLMKPPTCVCLLVACHVAQSFVGLRLSLRILLVHGACFPPLVCGAHLTCLRRFFLYLPAALFMERSGCDLRPEHNFLFACGALVYPAATAAAASSSALGWH